VSRTLREESLNRCASFGLLVSLLLFNGLVFSNLVKPNCLRSSSLCVFHGVGLLAVELICYLEETVSVVILQEAHHFLDFLILLWVGFLRIVSKGFATRARDQWTFQEFFPVNPFSLE